MLAEREDVLLSDAIERSSERVKGRGCVGKGRTIWTLIIVQRKRVRGWKIKALKDMFKSDGSKHRFCGSKTIGMKIVCGL
jgi:hypothetical protein